MSKNHRIGREAKKQPVLSPKEKKAAKRLKKHNVDDTGSLVSKIS